MAGSILAVTINSQGGAALTFALPVGVFVVVATVLYLLFTRPHSVPGHRAPVQAAAGGPGSAAPAGAPESSPAEPDGAADGMQQAAATEGTQQPAATEGTE